MWSEITLFRILRNIIFLHRLCQRHTIDTDSRAVNEATFIQFVKNAENTASTSALLNRVFLGVRSELTQTGHTARKLVDILHREVCTSLLGYGQQMEHSIGAATHGNIKSHCIHKGLAGGDAARQYALIAVLVIGKGILHHLTGCCLEEFHTVGMGSKDGTVARQREADCLGE